MGLTENQKSLIKAVSQSDFQKAKEWAIECLKEDTTQKNSSFCRNYIKLLEKNGVKLIEIPQGLSGLIFEEDLSYTFDENKYYLTERENHLFKEILKMKSVSDILTSMQINYKNTILLHGDTGTGKTLFGKYVAYKMKLPFCYMDITHTIDSYMGHTSKNITKVFEYVSSHPCVFMIDEIDGISNKRKTGNSEGVDGEISRATLSIMKELDKLHNNVIVIAATNRIDRLDNALLRRFSIINKIEKMNFEEQRHMIGQFLNNTGLDISDEDIESILKEELVQSKTIQKLIHCIASYLIKSIENDFDYAAKQNKENDNEEQKDGSCLKSYYFDRKEWLRDANGVYHCPVCHSQAKCIPLTKYCPDCGEKLIHQK